MAMLRELSWSERDWDLVVELLERENNELPSEIRHTSTSEYRDTLRARRVRIKRMLDEIRACREQTLS